MSEGGGVGCQKFGDALHDALQRTSHLEEPDVDVTDARAEIGRDPNVVCLIRQNERAENG